MPRRQPFSLTELGRNVQSGLPETESNNGLLMVDDFIRAIAISIREHLLMVPKDQTKNSLLLVK